MTKRKEIFKEVDQIWDDKIQIYRPRCGFDVLTPERRFKYSIAPRCGVNGYVKKTMDWPMPVRPRSCTMEMYPIVDPFIELLQRYFAIDVAERIFDMAFGASRGWMGPVGVSTNIAGK
jgi:hypothetical protein